MQPHKTTMLFVTTLVACDAQQDNDFHKLEIESYEYIDDEMLTELVIEERWENGLEELLDPVCDEFGCRWAWTNLEGTDLADLADELPEIPEDIDRPLEGRAAESMSAGTDIQTSAEAGTKLLTITSIRCIDRQELSGDEPYITVDGSRIWGGYDFTSGTTKQLYLAQYYTFGAEIEVWEDDPFFDDFIGGTDVWPWTINGQYTATFNGSSATYKIYYTVSSP